jgi:hypothetical protein
VAHLVIGDAASFLRAEFAASFLQTGDKTFDCYGEVVERHGLAIAPCRHDRGLIDKVGEIGTGEARRQPSDLVEIDVCGKLHLGDGSLVKGTPHPLPPVQYPRRVTPTPVPMVRIEIDPKRLPREGGYEVDRPAGVEAIPGYSVGQGRG